MGNYFNRALNPVRERVGPWMWLGMVLMPSILMGFYALGFASNLGINVFQENWLHEFFHDARHAAGFPCH